MRDVGIGLVGSGFIAEAHVEGFSHVPAAAVRGVASPTPGNAARFAEKHGIPRPHTDYRALRPTTCTATSASRPRPPASM